MTGNVNLTNLNRTRIEVRYPKPFNVIPNLVVESTHGNIELTLLEERPDGFVLEGGSASWSSDGLCISWIAKGVQE